MNVTRGKYEVRVVVDRFSDVSTIKQIYDTENKQKYKGSLYIGTRKQYDKFFEDLDKDIIPPQFRLWKKPTDVMDEDTVKRILLPDK